jgi:hypothetical protein
VALPFVENDSSATRGSSRSTRRQLSAEASAMSASASGVGSTFTAQSGEDERAVGETHHEIARRRAAAGRQAHRQHSRLDHSRRCVGGACNHRIGVADLHHQARVEQRLRREATRDLGVRVRASFEVRGGVRIEPVAGLRLGNEDRNGEVELAQPLAAATMRSSSCSGNTMRSPRPRIASKQVWRNDRRERAPGRQRNVDHSSFLIRATTLNTLPPRGWITAASPSARYGVPTTPRTGCRGSQ